MELTNAVKYGMPNKPVLLDNHGPGRIGMEQLGATSRLGRPPWSTRTGRGSRVCAAPPGSPRSLAEMDDAVDTLLSIPGPVLLHVEQDGGLV